MARHRMSIWRRRQCEERADVAEATAATMPHLGCRFVSVVDNRRIATTNAWSFRAHVWDSLDGHIGIGWGATAEDAARSAVANKRQQERRSVLLDIEDEHGFPATAGQRRGFGA